MFDTAIIGAGPAGLSAAANMKLHNKRVIWFGSERLSHKVRVSEKITNYPGFPYVSGQALAEAFENYRRQMELTVTERLVSQIMPTKQGYTLLAGNDVYEAKTLILAMGVMTFRELPGEKPLVGRGVSYCATCDGFLYKGKTIGVLCTSASLAHEVAYLAEMADKVYLFPYDISLHADGERIEAVPQKIASVNGKTRLESVTLSDGTVLPLDGLFCLRDAVAPTTLLPALATDAHHITVDRSCTTNLPGVFACGDCTGAPYQIAKAVGEGNVAAHSVIRYLAGIGENGRPESI